jgi:hypothetical protein
MSKKVVNAVDYIFDVNINPTENELEFAFRLTDDGLVLDKKDALIVSIDRHEQLLKQILDDDIHTFIKINVLNSFMDDMSNYTQKHLSEINERLNDLNSDKQSIREELDYFNSAVRLMRENTVVLFKEYDII